LGLRWRSKFLMFFPLHPPLRFDYLLAGQQPVPPSSGFFQVRGFVLGPPPRISPIGRALRGSVGLMLHFHLGLPKSALIFPPVSRGGVFLTSSPPSSTTSALLLHWKRISSHLLNRWSFVFFQRPPLSGWGFRCHPGSLLADHFLFSFPPFLSARMSYQSYLLRDDCCLHSLLGFALWMQNSAVLRLEVSGSEVLTPFLMGGGLG